MGDNVKKQADEAAKEITAANARAAAASHTAKEKIAEERKADREAVKKKLNSAAEEVKKTAAAAGAAVEHSEVEHAAKHGKKISMPKVKATKKAAKKAEKAAKKGDCSKCAKEFDAAGGCKLWMSGGDPRNLITKGCYHCEQHVSTHCGKAHGATCTDCVDKFAHHGGCKMWNQGHDPTGLIPKNCHHCGAEAAEKCHVHLPGHAFLPWSEM